MTLLVMPAEAASRAVAFDRCCNVACRESGFSRRICYIFKSFAVRANYRAIAALVSSLICPWNPSHIVRLIVSVIINAVHRESVSITMCQRPISKCGERLAPVVTHFDAACAIVAKGSAVWVATPIKHSLPDRPKPRLATSVSYAKTLVGIFSEAAARLSPAALQLRTGSYLFVAADTSTTPKCGRPLANFSANKFENGQATECLTRDIDDCGHSDLLERWLGQVMGRRSNVGPLRILAYGIPR